MTKAEKSQLRGWSIDRAIETIKACGIKDADEHRVMSIANLYADSFIADMEEEVSNEPTVN
jgi:hypothetical protein